LTFSRKHLSLETTFTSSAISLNLKNLLKIGTSGDISSMAEITSCQPLFDRSRLLLESLNEKGEFVGEKTL
jgi:hypothetical protein